jgi:HEAT repeat protein
MLTEVLRGMIAGLRLNPERLAKDANGWLNHLSDSAEHLWPSRAAKREMDPNSVRSACMDLRLLADALQHPSWFVASNAARLFEACGPTVNHQELLVQTLSQAQGTALFLVGSLADSIWGGDAFKILNDRLGGNLTAGCGYLYEPMVKAARSADESALAVSRALHGIAQGDPETAEMAADALCAADAQVLFSQADRIRQLFDEWRRTPSWCKECKRSVPGRSCASCSVTLPRPEVPLVRLLARIRAFSVPDLLGLASEENSGTREEARKAMVSFAFDDAPAMNALFSEINAGKDSGGLLDELLKQAPDRLRQFSDQVLQLLQSPFAGVRRRVIASLSSGWIDANTARELALKAIQDDSPPVRSAAAGFLKRQAEA